MRESKLLNSSRRPGLRATREPVIELRAGDYIQTIAAVAKETHADLIILGSQRRKPLAPLIGPPPSESPGWRAVLR